MKKVDTNQTDITQNTHTHDATGYFQKYISALKTFNCSSSQYTQIYYVNTSSDIFYRHMETFPRFSISTRCYFCASHTHDDVIKWKHFPRYWPLVRGIHRSPVNSPHKGEWRGALTFSLICACINGWVNNREAGDLSGHRAHYWHLQFITNFSVILYPLY